MYLFILYFVTTLTFSVLSAARSNTRYTTTHSYTHTTKPTALLRANLYLFLSGSRGYRTQLQGRFEAKMFIK